MGYKDILVPVIALAEDEAALAAGAAIATKFEAKATALVIRVRLSSEFADEAQPLSVVLEDIARIASSDRDAEQQRVRAWLERRPHAFEMRELTIESAAGQDRIVAHARVADIVVMARAKAHARARRALFEDILFKSGRPLMIVPELVRERMLLMLSGQESTGGGRPEIRSWSHQPGKMKLTPPEHYRSDDCLWLFNAVPLYVAETGDTDFYNVVVPYSDKGKATVFGHLRRALEFRFVLAGVDAIHRADVDAGGVLRTNARFSDDVSQLLSPPEN